jgi:hypothetical protein
MTDPRHKMRWVGHGCALAALVLGWLFIAWQNHFRLTAPIVFVGLAYLAVVATIYNLWRTGVAMVDSEDEGDSTWAKPAGALGELEREKRTLLKAIKEAEFDHQMGKLSKRDADEMIRVYRARAIEVIKDIEHLGHGAAGNARDQILREVRARLELEGKAQKKATEKAGKARIKQARDAGPKPAASAANPAAEQATAAAALDDAGPDTSTPEAAVEGAEAAVEAAVAPAPVPARSVLDDDVMDADSTTVESRDRAKEATR